jgi:hypothetical protein
MERRVKKKTAALPRGLARWILYLGFAWLAFAGCVRLIESVDNWYWYTFTGIQPGPWYLAASGGLWGAAGLVALAWLIFDLPRRRQVALWAAFFFAISYWLDRLLVGRPSGDALNNAFPALVTILGLGFALLTLRPWDERKRGKELQDDKK